MHVPVCLFDSWIVNSTSKGAFSSSSLDTAFAHANAHANRITGRIMSAAKRTLDLLWWVLGQRTPMSTVCADKYSLQTAKFLSVGWRVQTPADS